MNRRGRLSFSCLVMLLAAALLTRAGMPTGWMPMAGADGAVRIMLCDGYGPVELAQPAGKTDPHAHHHMAQGHDGGDHSLHHGGHGKDVPRDPCPFGVALSGATDLPGVPVEVAPEAIGAPLEMPALVAARLVAWRTARPPARGPPLPA